MEYLDNIIIIKSELKKFIGTTDKNYAKRYTDSNFSIDSNFVDNLKCYVLLTQSILCLNDMEILLKNAENKNNIEMIGKVLNSVKHDLIKMNFLSFTKAESISLELSLCKNILEINLQGKDND